MKRTFYLIAIILLCISSGCKNGTKANSTKDGENDLSNSTSKIQSSQLNDSTILVADSFELFLRETKKPLISTGIGDVKNNQLWIRYKSNREDELLVECRDNEDPKKLIGNIFAALMSVDNKKVYFMCDAWATSAAVHEVDIATKKEKYICDGNSLAVLQKGKYKGMLIVNQHKYSTNIDEGSYDHFFIVNENGKVLEKLGEKIPEKYEKEIQ